jgi:hypothetical protein
MTDKKLNKPTTTKKPLKELKMSWAGKLFFASLAGYLGSSAYMGVQASKQAPRLPIKIRGSKQQIKAVMQAITSSKAFQAEINRPGATIESVIAKLKLKDLNKRQFEKLTGRKWPL